MKLSCIVPVYNGEKYIRECLMSILKQKFSGFEIIVVDDGSTDDTLDVLRKTMGIKIIESRHVGRSAVRNIGLRAARADVVFFVEADAFYSPNFLADCYRHFEDDSVGGVIGKLEVWNLTSVWTKCRAAELNARFSDYKPFTGWMYRKELVEKAGGFVESLNHGEDILLGKKVRDLGYRIVFERKAVWKHKEPDTLGKVYRRAFVHGRELVAYYRRAGFPVKAILMDLVVFGSLLLSIFYVYFLMVFLFFVAGYLFAKRKYFFFIEKKYWLHLAFYLVSLRLVFGSGRMCSMMS
ncbi:MAG: glycosyltransferase, partial [archaeon]